jgi:hypothetical protein
VSGTGQGAQVRANVVRDTAEHTTASGAARRDPLLSLAVLLSPRLGRHLRTRRRHGGGRHLTPRVPMRPRPSALQRELPTLAAAQAGDDFAPLPLDSELPAGSPRRDPLAYVASHRRGVLWVIAGVALALRLLLLPLGHWWDITTFYNTFVDLGRNQSPYETMRYMSALARSAGWNQYYEYYAYPPGPIYLYYPLARLFLLLHPHAEHFFAVSGSYAVPQLPWDFYVFYKLPIWVADFGVAAVLARLTGTVRAWRDYLLNPYVLLVSGAWTFDAIMVLGLVLGVYWLQRGRVGWAGVALAVGTMVKFVPGFIVPTCALYLIKRRRPPREVALFLGAYLLVCLVMTGPFLQGMLYAVGFQGARYGGGMNPIVYLTLWRLHPQWNAVPALYAVSAFGTPALALALLLAYWYTYVTEMPLSRMVLVTLLAYLVGTKLVNEQYALSIFPFTLIEARRLGGVWRWLHRGFWLTALVFAIMHVPIDHFLWPLYHTLFGARADVIARTGITGFDSHLFPWNHERIQPIAVLVLGVTFTVLCLLGIFWPVRTTRRVPLAELGRAGTALGVAGSGASRSSPGAADATALAPVPVADAVRDGSTPPLPARPVREPPLAEPTGAPT